MTSFLLLLLISPLRTSPSTSMLQVCDVTAEKHTNCLYKFFKMTSLSLPLLHQAPSFCSCLTPRGSTPVGSSGGAETPLLQTARGHSAARSGWVTTGPTTPCWPRPGGRAHWATRGSPTACSETSPTSVPTRTTDCSASGTAAKREWTPVLPDRKIHKESKKYHEN